MLDALSVSIGGDEPDDNRVRAAIAYISFPTLVDELLDSPVPPVLPRTLREAVELNEPNDPWLRPDVLAVLERADETLISPADLARCYGKVHVGTTKP